jgi:hypothetical protein
MTGLADRMEAALRRGVAFLLARQGSDGSWTDWALPPGSSADWTTAYVGLRLAALGKPFRVALRSPLDRAARWLLARGTVHRGWGYNSAVEQDADSTALALLFLAGSGIPAPPGAYAALMRYQRDDGGFSTFLPDGLTGSWGHSHPEITPIALLALRGVPDIFPPASQYRALAAIHRARRPDGTWNSFWWTSPLPACEANLAGLRVFGQTESLPEKLRRLSPQDGLQAALLLSISARREQLPRLAVLTRTLLVGQMADGGWHGTASLRIPPRNCARPWDASGISALYADPQRLFTTATAVAALGAAYRRLALPTRTRRQVASARSLPRLSKRYGALADLLRGSRGREWD